jgi:hypothetical protein
MMSLSTTVCSIIMLLLLLFLTLSVGSCSAQYNEQNLGKCAMHAAVATLLNSELSRDTCRHVIQLPT